MKEIKEGVEFIEMYEVLESYGNERFEDGIVEGDENRSRKVVLNLLKQNFSLTIISKSVERSVVEIESWARNPEFHITSIDCIDCLLNYRQSYLFGIKWLIGTSEALINRCKMSEDQKIQYCLGNMNG